MNHTEFLKDTVEYYTADTNRRAICQNGDCKYLTHDGKKCAVGRYLDDNHPKYNLIVDQNPTADDLYDFNCTMFLPEIRSLDKDFIRAVQKLHDVAANWYSTRLSEDGEFYYKYLLNQADKLDNKP